MFMTFPGFAFIFYDEIITIAKFEVIEFHEETAAIFGLDPEEEPFNDLFDRLRYSSKNFLMNSGFILLMLLSTVILFTISFILLLVSYLTSKLNYCRVKLDQNLYWGFVIRLLLELTMELSIICIMEIALVNFSSWGYVFSYTFSVIMVCTLIGSALQIRFCMRKRDLSSPRFIQRMGAAYEGLKPLPTSLAITEWFIYRRVIYAAAVFFAQGKLWL